MDKNNISLITLIDRFKLQVIFHLKIPFCWFNSPQQLMGLFVPKLLKANLSNRFRRSLKEETDPFITLININLVHILTKRATEGMKLQKSITCVAYNQVQTGPTCFRGKKFTSLLGLAMCVCVCVCVCVEGCWNMLPLHTFTVWIL